MTHCFMLDYTFYENTDRYILINYSMVPTEIYRMEWNS